MLQNAPLKAEDFKIYRGSIMHAPDPFTTYNKLAVPGVVCINSSDKSEPAFICQFLTCTSVSNMI